MPLLRRPVRDPLIAEVLRRLEDANDATAPPAQWAIGVVVANLLRLASTIAVTSRPNGLSTDELNTLVARVRTNIDQPWPVQRLADEAGLSRRPFAAAFKAAVGMPVHQYVMTLRCECAIELLQATDLPLAAVAARSGFANQAHLTRVMNGLVRTTPGRVRSTPRHEVTELPASAAATRDPPEPR